MIQAIVQIEDFYQQIFNNYWWHKDEAFCLKPIDTHEYQTY